MTTTIDRSCDPNLDRVARITAELGERIRDEDPRALFAEVVKLCERHPAKAAQMILTFAVWFDPDESVETLVRRAESVSAGRVPVLL